MLVGFLLLRLVPIRRLTTRTDYWIFFGLYARNPFMTAAFASEPIHSDLNLSHYTIKSIGII